MTFIGSNFEAEQNMIRFFHERGDIVTEDLMHSLISDNIVSSFCDYLIIALRTRFPIPAGGWVGKKTAN